ncbi:F0F1 ATP synthase subunit delta [Clostridium sp. CX1]|uniref:ATP synthase subunit delta n=1 Tax=Clostridium tanneri TaxID=3037988 RepID=A0ABU4JRR8_9CLOT|nr:MULTISPECIES: F0F1 ATP synthase subunit delta [unclassified Clostridium]MCT8975808.1 F0F1 ATP synthase subunit delta [Clostridium sp. CX1]MDW8800661.1 F0F1 ATP synthase subunit delta [Clostridium sp. A1-XYC3]
MYEYLDRRYALALYKVAEENGKVEQYLEELRNIVALINNDEEFLQLIKHPQVSTSSKKKLFEQIFKGRIDDNLLSFLLVLIDKGRILQLEGKLNEMEKIHLLKKNQVVAKVKTVIPLLDEEKKSLTEKLEKKFNKKVLLEEEIDSSIIGGIYVQVDNEVIDGTIKSKLEEMKKLMLKRD